MRGAFRRQTVAVSALLMLGTVICSEAAADTPAKNAAARHAATEQVIHDYLLAHPEVIREALALQQQREAAADAAAKKQALAANRDELVADPASPVLGNPEGDVTIVEFFDYRCGYCKRVESAVEALLKTDNKVKLVLKEFPILGKDSWVAAKAALAAHKQGRYAEFHSALLKAETVDEAAVEALASSIGLDMEKFRSDRDNAESGVIEKNHRLAAALGISGTPAFVIGDRLLPGAADEATLAAHVNAVRLARAIKQN